MRAALLVLLFWAVASAHPVPGPEPAHPHHGAEREDTATEDDSNKLGDLLGAGGGRHSPASAGRGDNSLVREPVSGNAVGEELAEHGGHSQGGRAGEAQHLNQVDHGDASAWDGNSLGFLEEDARDTDDGDHRGHHGPALSSLPSHAGGFPEEEDESGDDSFDQNGEEERGEGPTYAAGADGEGGHGAGHGAGGGRGDSSSSSSSESAGEDHWRYRSYLGSRYRQGGHSSSSQQEEEDEESYDFGDEAMQGDDPSVFDGLGGSYRGHRAGPRALGGSRESGQGAGSHRWEEGDSRSPELEEADSAEDSPSVEDSSDSQEPDASPSEENSPSRSEEDEDGEDSPSRESEDSESREDSAEQADEQLQESPEDISQETLSRSEEHRDSRDLEEQQDQESAEDRSQPSAPDSESEEEEGNQSKSREDASEQSQSAEDTAEESEEEENDSAPDGDTPSASAESRSSSLQEDGSQEDNTGEDSSSTESNSDSQQGDDDDEEEESRSQEEASSSRGDASSPQSLESSSRRRRPGAYRHKPAADYDDNDCQDGY
ncbi:dentin matrix acidic phosphoprotein 1-like [Dryobates pubescens]|uniref:dentin matrix acidic phosphoprotein 1-like n=1 Tax=Dryobates pubescens TaxID=118200 RepID=UPI0023BA241B|nr:dentin matrix acidic phosphoprotein 1-like [Dryobates pubescens]